MSTCVRQATLNSVTELHARPATLAVLAAPAALSDGARPEADSAAGSRYCDVRFWAWAPGEPEFMPRDAFELPLA